MVAEAKPRTTKQEFDSYIYFLYNYYNTILAIDLDKIILDYYRDGEVAIVSKRQYAVDKFRYIVAVLLDKDSINDNVLLSTINKEASALSIIA